MKEKLWILIGFTLIFMDISAQNIHGVVYGNSGSYAEGAVVMADHNESTLTDSIGRFYLPKGVNDSLYIQYQGILTAISVEGQDFVSFVVPESIVLHNATIIARKSRQITNFTEVEKIRRLQTPALQTHEIYNEIPGLFMHTGSFNTNRLTIRGIGSRSPFSTKKIKAYFNEVPITNGNGETNVADFSLGIVDAMQVHKGPSASSYGANLGGTILFKNYAQGRPWKIRNSVSYSSFNTIRNNLSMEGRSKNAQGVYNYEILFSDGYRDNNKFIRYTRTGFVTVGRKNLTLNVFTLINEAYAEIPSALNIDDFHDNPSKAADNWKAVNGREEYTNALFGASLVIKPNKRLYISITPFLKWFDNDEKRPFDNLTQDLFSRGLRSNNTYSYHKNARITAGFETFREKEDIRTREIDEDKEYKTLQYETRRVRNFFLEHQFKYKKFVLDLGVNYNESKYELEDFISAFQDVVKYSYDPLYSPFSTLHYRHSAVTSYYVKMAKGFSTPTLEETLYNGGVRVPDLRQEIGINYEVGFQLTSDLMNLSASCYYMRVSDLLVLDRFAEDQFRWNNAGLTSHPGLEVTANKRYKISDKLRLTWYVSGQYAPHRFVEFTQDDIDFAGNLLPGNPSLRISARARLQYDKFYLELQDAYTGTQFADDENTIEVGDYNLVNAQLGCYIVKSKHWSISTQVAAGNVFNAHYASMVAINPQSFGGNLPRYLYPGLPRNFSSNLKIAYTLR